MAPKIKTVSVTYAIKVNSILADNKPTLREARATVKSMPVNDGLHNVTISKLTTTEQILDTYEPKTITVLTASQLDDGMLDET